MLLSQMLAVALSMTGHVDALDPVDTARDSFNSCLRAFVNTSVEAHKTTAQIHTEIAQQCATQEAAYRAAMIRSDLAVHVSQADAERNATQEITDSRENTAAMVADAEQPH